MIPGTRVRFNDKCVWPERRGCEGVVVAPKVPDQYPHAPRDKGRVLVLLDDDPLRTKYGAYDVVHDGCEHDWWTCATSKDSLDPVSAASDVTLNRKDGT